VDVRFGPRGDLYICDWFNPVKGHMQYSLRDTRRDKTAGRIWRVTAKGRPLDEAPKIAGEPIEKLLDLLKAYEYRTRYTAKMELRMRDDSEVIEALDKWLPELDPNDPEVEHHKLEALWMFYAIGRKELLGPPHPRQFSGYKHPFPFGKPPPGESIGLLKALLNSSSANVRAAAVRQLRWSWKDDTSMTIRPIQIFRQACNDPSGLVRLEAAITASCLPDQQAAEIALDLLKHPMDSYTTYALRTALDSLKPVWSTNAAFAAREDLKKFYTDSEPKKKRSKEKPDPFDKLNPTVVKIGTVAERMLFTVTEFTVKAGAPVKLVFDNTDATPHNLLILQPGAEDEVGLAAIEMAKQPEALASMNFTPKSDKIIQASQMLKQGEVETLRFHAPKEPGRYPYICSFPGHYLVMKGVMIVE
jgi:uncharacterized cupredoxin-like copper-binding protein